MCEPNTDPTKEALVEEQTRVQGVASWTECTYAGCHTRCPQQRCEEHELSATTGVGSGPDLDSIQTGPDMSIVDDLVDGETEMTSVLHRVDDLRIVRLDDAIGTEYRIEEREAGSWKKRTTLTRDQLLLAAGMVNKQWSDD